MKKRRKLDTGRLIFLHIIKQQNILFLLVALLALLVSFIPVLSIPFDWVASFFRESSQAFLVFLSGGRIENIQLNLDGGGFCIASEDYRPFAIFFSYILTMLVGLGLYVSIELLQPKHYDLAAAVVGIIILIAAFMARELITLAIMSVIFIMFLVSFKFLFDYRSYFLLKFISVYLMIEPVKASGRGLNPFVYSDADEMSYLTGYNKYIWLGLWCFLGLYFIWKIAKMHVVKSDFQKYLYMKTPKQLSFEFIKR